MLHLLKLCVGCDSVEDLAQWQRNRSPVEHWTRNHPKRGAEIIAGGSLYWIIKGQVRVRQRIMKLDRRERVCPRAGTPADSGAATATSAFPGLALP